MPNRKLNLGELQQAAEILAQVRARLTELAAGDQEVLFALRRKVYKELIYDERSKPVARRKLKHLKYEQQGGKCALCGEAMPIKYSELDRIHAPAGYTPKNTRLVHADCHHKAQSERGWS